MQSGEIVLYAFMSGIEACRKLSAGPLTRKIPIIFVTSMEDKHNEESALKAGAVDYISKLPAPGVVRALVAVHLEKTRQSRLIEAIASSYISDPEKIRETAKELARS